MKKLIFISGLAFASLLLSCKKTPTDDILPADDNSNLAAYQKADDATAKAEYDKINDDIEKVYKDNDFSGARIDNSQAVVLPCGKVTLNPKSFKIDYNDTTCGSKVLSGSIDVTLKKGNKFSDIDAELEVKFTDYKVYYNASKSSVTYNGKQIIKNITGGKFADLKSANSISHSVRGTLEVSFDSLGKSSKKRDWSIFRKKTFTSTGVETGLSFTLDGDTIINGKKVSEYGTNKDGYPYVNEVETPFKWENCGDNLTGPYILKTGIVNHTATNDLGILGKYTGHFSIYAGYTITTGVIAFNGTCESAGYKLMLSFKKDGVAIGTPSTWFQEYNK